MNRREFLFGALAAGAVLPVMSTKGVEKSAARKLRIAHMTDPQFGFGPGKGVDAKYAADLKRFERALEMVNDLKPDLALITGDMTNRPQDVARDWPRLLGLFKVPVLVAPGNHDLGMPVLKANRDRYLSVFGYDYKSIDIAGWRVIAGNTQFWRKTDLVDEQAKYEAWLKDELNRAKAEMNGRVIVAGHIPPFVGLHNEKDSYENCPKVSRHDRMRAYRHSGVRFFLAGHTHRMAMRGFKELTILNAETTGNNFDQRPQGFRMFEVNNESDYSYNFVKV